MGMSSWYEVLVVISTFFSNPLGEYMLITGCTAVSAPFFLTFFCSETFSHLIDMVEAKDEP
jgi:hypothetical protein